MLIVLEAHTCVLIVCERVESVAERETLTPLWNVGARSCDIMCVCANAPTPSLNAPLATSRTQCTTCRNYQCIKLANRGKM